LGYVLPSKWNYIEVWQDPQNEIEIDSTAGDINLSTIYVPSYIGNLIRAVLLMNVTSVRNSNAANNNGINSSQDIQIQDTGLTYRNAISIPAGTFYTYPTTTMGGSFIFNGATNIRSYITPNYNFPVKWKDADAYFDSMWLYGLQIGMRLYFE